MEDILSKAPPGAWVSIVPYNLPGNLHFVTAPIGLPVEEFLPLL